MIRILAIVLALVSLLMIPALVMAAVLGEHAMTGAFLLPLGIGLFMGLSVILFFRKIPQGFRTRDGFLLVFLIWVFSSLLGSLPYYFAPLGIGWANAIFESSCCFATTGATIFPDIEALPKSLLFWRSISHWAGGMGIIVLSVALVPLLGAGGFQLIKAEAPGPEKEKLKPKITETAKMLWGVYCFFTALLVLLYRAGGMNWFDAVCHGLTVLATGGISTRNEGFAFFDSPFIDWVTIVFMFLGAMNFNMFYRIVHGKFREVFQNTESRVYSFIFVISALIITISLIPDYGSFGRALRFGSFQAASFLSTTGTARADYTAWPPLAQAVLFCLMFVGGCSGSTAGGIKVIRHAVLFKQAGNELRRILYPQGVFSIQLNKKAGRKDVVYGAAGFVFLYFMVVAATTLITAASGTSIFSSFSIAASMVSNIGAGFGAAGPLHNYSDFPGHLKLIYSLVMIAGRLELWTVVILFTPGYWRG